MFRKTVPAVCLAALSVVCAAQTPPPFVALGDSLGEGVQSADANQRTQPRGYLNLIAKQMGVPFALPLIKTSHVGAVGSPNGRSRIDLSVMTPNLAVSGATSGSILYDSASEPIVNETDMVLSPRTGTQIQIAQSLQAPFMICWIGNNDALGAVLDVGHLNGRQTTPLSVFESNIHRVVQSLTGWGAKVVFANVPDVTKIGFLMNSQDLTTFLGNNYGFPEGSLTSVITMLSVKLGMSKPGALQRPGYVLDPNEIQRLQHVVNEYNKLIAIEASAAGFPVMDAHALFDHFVTHPKVYKKITLTNRFNGGLFSLDGAHPSDIGYAFVANAFIDTANSFYHMNIPRLSHHQLRNILRTDPFVDFNGNLIVRGRPHAGLLETLGPKLGISGDKADGPIQPGIDKNRGEEFMRAYFTAIGKDPNTPWNEQDGLNALAQVFGVAQYAR